MKDQEFPVQTLKLINLAIKRCGTSNPFAVAMELEDIMVERFEVDPALDDEEKMDERYRILEEKYFINDIYDMNMAETQGIIYGDIIRAIRASARYEKFKEKQNIRRRGMSNQ